jgi:hypothetical protein
MNKNGLGVKAKNAHFLKHCLLILQISAEEKCVNGN